MRSLRRASTPSWTGCSALDEVQHHRKLAPIHPLPSGGRLAMFCKLPIDLYQAVQFVNHMIGARL